jgi:hypothetical protein
MPAQEPPDGVGWQAGPIMAEQPRFFIRKILNKVFATLKRLAVFANVRRQTK